MLAQSVEQGVVEALPVALPNALVSHSSSSSSGVRGSALFFRSPRPLSRSSIAFPFKTWRLHSKAVSLRRLYEAPFALALKWQSREASITRRLSGSYSDPYCFQSSV